MIPVGRLKYTTILGMLLTCALDGAESTSSDEIGLSYGGTT